MYSPTNLPIFWKYFFYLSVYRSEITPVLKAAASTLLLFAISFGISKSTVVMCPGMCRLCHTTGIYFFGFCVLPVLRDKFLLWKFSRNYNPVEIRCRVEMLKSSAIKAINYGNSFAILHTDFLLLILFVIGDMFERKMYTSPSQFMMKFILCIGPTARHLVKWVLKYRLLKIDHHWGERGMSTKLFFNDSYDNVLKGTFYSSL